MVNIKNNKIPIKTVASLLKIKPDTVYKHCERRHYKKDDKSNSVVANTFIDYLGEMGRYHQKKYEFYTKLYRDLKEG